MAEITQQPKKNNTSNGGKTILIIVVVILLLLNAVQGILFTYPHLTEVPAMRDSLELREAEIAETLKDLQKLKQSLEKTKAELEAMGIENTELNSQLEELNVTLDKAQKSKGWALNQMNKLKADKKAYEQMLNQMETRIKNLEATAAQQDTIINELKQEKVAMTDTLNMMNENMNTLQDEISKGKTLVASEFQVTAVNKNGKEKIKDEYRSKDLYQAKIEFMIAENQIADIEKKDLYMQIIDPSGSTIYDLEQGGGEFEANGEPLFYTINQPITYNRSSQKVVIMYQKNSDYESGTHKVNVFTDGKRIGSGKFEVK